MRILAKRTLLVAAAGALVGGALSTAAAPAGAAPATCDAGLILATVGYSECTVPVQHRVRVVCRGFASTYERYGNYAWGGQRSWAWCDAPFTAVGAYPAL